MPSVSHGSHSGKQAFPEFTVDNASLVRKHLTQDCFNALASRTTPAGFTLRQAINDSMINPDSSIGIYAGDPESYTVFSDLFLPIIEDYHGLSSKTDHLSDLNVPDLDNLDPEGRYILTSRIRVARNIDGFAFMPSISRNNRETIARKVTQALDDLPQDLSGRTLPIQQILEQGKEKPLPGITPFARGDRFQEAAGINRDWPESRAVFTSRSGNLIIWINEEDHLRIISLDQGSDLTKTFRRLARCLNILKNKLSFAVDPRLGHLTSCPSNLGTAMRAGVHIRLPKLARNPKDLERIAREHTLQIRGTQGEKTRVENAVFDISNSRRLGITEKNCIETLHRGLTAIIRKESDL